jgi:hypothetical protein
MKLHILLQWYLLVQVTMDGIHLYIGMDVGIVLIQD